MEGKIVKINEDFLKILYPEYTFKTYVSFLDRGTKVIYHGKYFNGLKDYLTKNTKSFISVVGNPELDLSSKDAIAEYVFTLKNRTYSDTYRNFFDTLDDTEFYYSLKTLYVTGRVPYTVTDSNSMYKLFQSLTEPTMDMLKTYFSLLNTYPFRVLESSFLTFLSRVSTLSTDGVSPRYSLLIKQTHAKIGRQLKSATLSYVTSEQTEIDFMNLLLSLRK